MKRVLILGSIIIVAGMVSLARVLSGDPLAERARSLHERRAPARVAADSCANALAAEQAVFEMFSAEVDSLRADVESYESADRTVDSRRYQEYLEKFGTYNDAVPVWEARADTLRAHDAACRALVARHNALVDSLRIIQDSLRARR